MTRVSVVIAYDGTGADRIRRGAYEKVLRHLLDLHKPIFVACDTHQPYRLAYAVNRCVRNHPCDVFLLNYADVIVPLKQVRQAIRLALDAPGQVFAFDEYHRVMEPDGDYELPMEQVNANACMAIQRECFLEVGGYDEKFVGWAMEDKEFNDRCGARWPARRVPGRLEHLWHGERRGDDSALETSAEQVAANRAYYASLSG